MPLKKGTWDEGYFDGGGKVINKDISSIIHVGLKSVGGSVQKNSGVISGIAAGSMPAF